MNVRNGIRIERPSQHRKSTKSVDGKLENYSFYKGKMVEMGYQFADNTEGILLMPARQEWIEEYLADGWKIRSRWIAE